MSFEYPKEPTEFCEDCVWDVLAERDKRIERLEGIIRVNEGLMRDMAALLDRVPHNDYTDSVNDRRCHKDCPACAWAKMKEGK